MRTIITLLMNAVAVLSANPQLSFSTCIDGSPSQQFYYDASNTSLILAATGNCIDILAYGVTPGSEAYTAPCHHDDRDPSHQNQNFSAPLTASPGAPIVEMMSGLSLDGGGANPAVGALISLGAGTPLYLRIASPKNGGTGPLVHAASGLCVDAGMASFPGPPALLRTCDDARASWQLLSTTAAPGALALVTPDMQSGAPLCLTALVAMPGTGELSGSACVAGGTALQNFSLAAGQLVLGSGADLAVGAATAAGGPFYSGLGTALAAAGDAFAVNGSAAAFRLVHTASQLCLDIGYAPWGHACLDAAQRTLPYCNAALTVDARVADLLGRLTLSEKIALTGSGFWTNGASSCDTIDPGIPRLSVPPKQWLVETNSMAASQCYGSSCATSFPSALNLAASGNRSLWREKGRVVSKEMRALNNLAWHRADGGTSFVGLNGFGPDINQPRDPRNGRIGELASEDAFLTGAYAVEYLLGMQETTDDGFLRMSAGVKHYAGVS